MIENYQTQLKGVIETSLIRSARCLSELINNKVLIADLSISQDSMDDSFAALSKSLHSRVVLLKTEIVGPVAGINYSLFTGEEVMSLCKSVITEDLGVENTSEFTIGFLKEIENVLAAAVISEIADQVSELIYGDVPKIQAVDSAGVKAIIEQEIDLLYPDTYVYCTFPIPELGISPRIMWFFNEALTSGVMKPRTETLVA